MLAYAMADQKKMDGALRAAQKALALSPNDGNIMDTLGEIHLRRQEWQPALTQLRNAIARLGNNAPFETHEKYGEALVALKKKDEGIAELRKALPDRGKWGQRARAKLKALKA